MEHNDKKLLLSMMDDHADTLSNAGCNDWRWPEGWSEGYRRDFLERVGDAVVGVNLTYNSTYGPPDFIVWAYLIRLIKQEVKA